MLANTKTAIDNTDNAKPILERRNALNRKSQSARRLGFCAFLRDVLLFLLLSALPITGILYPMVSSVCAGRQTVSMQSLLCNMAHPRF